MKVEGVAFTVVGAGRSGVAAANLLAGRGADVLLTEGRAEVPRPEALHPEASFLAGSNAPREGDVAVLSPGIPEVSPVRGEVASLASEVLGEVELFFRLCPATVLAITGTDGKSTTTTMLGSISESAGRPTFVGGNLGNPLTEELDQLSADHVVVAEVSAFQLTTCQTFRPSVAIVTNISEDHLDYHGGYEPYQAAKRRIFAQMAAGDTLIVNGDDPIIGRWALPDGPTLQTFSLMDEEADGFLSGTRLMVRVQGEPVTLMDRSELRVLGIHNVANALAAALAGLADADSEILQKLGVERLVGMAVRARDAPMRAATIAFVSKLARDSDTHEEILAAGGLERLIGMILRLNEEAVWGLASMSSVEDNWAQIAEVMTVDAFGALKDLIELGGDYGKEGAAWACCYLAGHPSLQVMMIKANVLLPLVGLVKSGSRRVKKAAERALKALAS